MAATMPIQTKGPNSRIPGSIRGDDKLAAASYKIDNNIEASWVQQVDENGKLSEPKRLRILMDEIAASEVVLCLDPTSQYPDTAIVKVVERDELLRQAAEKAYQLKQVKKKSKESKPKQLELNWAIGGNDFEIKLKQMTDFLDKGKRVEVLLAPKRRQRKATPEEGRELVTKLRQKIEAIGATEIKPLTGAMLGQVTLTVQKTQSS